MNQDTLTATDNPRPKAPPHRFCIPRQYAFPLVLSVICAAVPIIYFGPAIIDDAYITFRYAYNLAQGNGFVFNVGEGPILGTSTPLFTLLLAAFEFCGIASPAGARILTFFGAWSALFFGMCLMRTPLSQKAGWFPAAAWAIVLSGLPQWVFALQSGMETVFFIGLCMPAIWACATRRVILCGALAGLVVLTRYDGWALALLLLAANFRGDRRMAIKAVVLFALLQIPWVVFTIAQFGSYAPHSVLAKRLIHARSFLENLNIFYQYFWGQNRSDMIGLAFHARLAPFFLLALPMLFIRRNAPSLLIAAWGALMVIGFCASGLTIFEWYLAPVLAVFCWLAIWGLWAFPQAIPKFRILSNNYFLLAIILILASLEWATVIQNRGKLGVRVLKEQAYLDTSDWVRRNAPPGGKILVGEVGALGWGLKDYMVIDSSGINSHAAYLARLRNAQALMEQGLVPTDEGSSAWVLALARDLQPDFVVALTPHLHLPELQGESKFTSRYRPVHMIQATRKWEVQIWQKINMHAKSD